MNITTNPLIGTSKRETIENAAEALSAALVLMADSHSDLCRLLMPVLQAVEHASEVVASDAPSTTDGEHEAEISGNHIAEHNRCVADVRALSEA